MLHHLAGALDVPVSFFFDGMDEDGLPPLPAGRDPLRRRESLELMRRYQVLPEAIRRSVYALVKDVVGE